MPKKRPQNDSDDAQQLGLNLGDNLEVSSSGKLQKTRRELKQAPGRIERVQARDWLESAIARLQGDDECYRNCTARITWIAFGLSPKDLYERLGGLLGDRDTLPEAVQNKLMVHELTIAPALDAQTITAETQAEINALILQMVSRQSRATEEFLKLCNLYQGLVEEYSASPRIAPE